MGKGKKLKDEDELLDRMEDNPGSVRCPDFKWLLDHQEWIRTAKGRKGADRVYRNDILAPFRDDKELRGGKRTPEIFGGFCRL